MKSRIPYTLIIALLIIFATGCKNNELMPDLKGVESKPWYEPIPFGMSYIKKGSFKMGSNDETLDNPTSPGKVVSVNSFWMDDTEITNDEYLQYVNWVTDSTAISLTFNNGNDYYKLTKKDEQPYDPPIIDWSKANEVWKDKNPDVIDAINPIFYQGKEKFVKKGNEIDYRKIVYSYTYIDLKQAALSANQFNYKTQKYEGQVTDHQTGEVSSIADRSSFFIEKNVAIYPDTLCWVRDFSYSYNEPWTLNYFYHTAYRDYPVVGVTWEQANAFCNWRSNFKDDYLQSVSIQSIHPYRLPTEAEWEYAARGGLMGGKYPWGGYYTSSEIGCYKANFKPRRGNYGSDSKHTIKVMKVGSFDPNGYGLYDMAGNVSEWTYDAYDASGYQFESDLNPAYQYNAKYDDPPAMKRKVIRGGSWKDASYYTQVGIRDYEYQDSTKSFIGFRCVMNAIEDNVKIYK